MLISPIVQGFAEEISFQPGESPFPARRRGCGLYLEPAEIEVDLSGLRFGLTSTSSVVYPSLQVKMLWVGRLSGIISLDAYIIANIAKGSARIGVRVHLLGIYR
jgi:hypothetical protein